MFHQLSNVGRTENMKKTLTVVILICSKTHVNHLVPIMHYVSLVYTRN